MTIKDILSALPTADRDAVMAAFEAGESYYVEYEPGRFLGVNTDAIRHLVADQAAGSFREGTIVRRGADAAAPAG